MTFNPLSMERTLSADGDSAAWGSIAEAGHAVSSGGAVAAESSAAGSNTAAAVTGESVAVVFESGSMATAVAIESVAAVVASEDAAAAVAIESVAAIVASEDEAAATAGSESKEEAIPRLQAAPWPASEGGMVPAAAAGKVPTGAAGDSAAVPAVVASMPAPAGAQHEAALAGGGMPPFSELPQLQPVGHGGERMLLRLVCALLALALAAPAVAVAAVADKATELRHNAWRKVQFMCCQLMRTSTRQGSKG